MRGERTVLRSLYAKWVVWKLHRQEIRGFPSSANGKRFGVEDRAEVSLITCSHPIKDILLYEPTRSLEPPPPSLISYAGNSFCPDRSACATAGFRPLGLAKTFVREITIASDTSLNLQWRSQGRENRRNCMIPDGRYFSWVKRIAPSVANFLRYEWLQFQ